MLHPAAGTTCSRLNILADINQHLNDRPGQTPVSRSELGLPRVASPHPARTTRRPGPFYGRAKRSHVSSSLTCFPSTRYHLSRQGPCLARNLTDQTPRTAESLRPMACWNPSTWRSAYTTGRARPFCRSDTKNIPIRTNFDCPNGHVPARLGPRAHAPGSWLPVPSTVPPTESRPDCRAHAILRTISRLLSPGTSRQ